MNNEKTTVLAAAVILAIVQFGSSYLLWAPACWEWNPAEWGFVARFLAVMIPAGALLLSIDNLLEDEE